MITEFLFDQIVVSVAIATFVCQSAKAIDKTIRKDKFEWTYFVDTGGMPSSHATFVCSLAASIGFVDGFISSVFLLAVGFAIIVMRDAVGVRHTVDDLKNSINEMIREKRFGIKQMFGITGHTPVQVAVGAIIGILIPIFFELLIYR